MQLEIWFLLFIWFSSMLATLQFLRNLPASEKIEHRRGHLEWYKKLDDGCIETPCSYSDHIGGDFHYLPFSSSVVLLSARRPVAAVGLPLDEFHVFTAPNYRWSWYVLITHHCAKAFGM
jgi:hypothetical protein